MTRADNLAFLGAEIAALDKMLGTSGVVGALERPGLTARRAKLAAELALLEQEMTRLGSADLTFSGHPVRGSLAIEATFASKALEAFERVISTIRASMTAGPLSARGPLPGRESHPLYITGLARGSFGFRFEEAVEADDVALTHPSPLATALSTARDLLEAGVAGDEQLADATSEADERVIVALRTFAKVLVDQSATCAIVVRDRRFAFESVEQVARAMSRFSGENVRQFEDTFVGKLYVLPATRRFELHTADGKILQGRVDASVDQRDVLLANNYQVELKAKVTSVGATGQARRLLMLSVTRQSTE